MRIVLVHGASVDWQNNYGDTALIMANRKGHADVVRLLLERGASVDLQDNDGNTALIMANWKGHTDVPASCLSVAHPWTCKPTMVTQR